MKMRKLFRKVVPENIRITLRDSLGIKKSENNLKLSDNNSTFWQKKYTKQLEKQLQNNLQARLRTYYAENYDTTEINKKTILFEVRDGTSFTDSPYAIFNKMASDRRFLDFHFVISFSEDKRFLFDDLKLKYPDIDLKMVVRESFPYMKMLLQAKYLVNNSTFNSYFTKKEGQIYINTWHGTALKHMGFSYVQDPMNSKNVLRNFLMADYILSPNEHMSKVFLQSYKLDGIWNGTILEGGLPRNDAIFQNFKEKIITGLTENHLLLDQSKKNIFYMPTWRGTDVNGANNVLVSLKNEMEKLIKNFGNEYNIFIKVHPFIYDLAQKSGLFEGILIPNSYDTNELFQITDILITDYSSVYFDFLITSKPILFYAWDNDIYETDRGMYFSENSLPGPVAYTFPELIDNIKNIDLVSSDFDELYRKNQVQFVSHEDGLVTERYIDRIFNHKQSDKIKEITAKNSKIKLLIHPGAMLDNGITNSFINLMSQLDYEKYDVTAFLHDSTEPEIVNNFNRLDKRVRKMFKPGLPIYTVEENVSDRYLKSDHKRGAIDKFYPEKGYQRESSRLFGNIKYDVAIDFSGYSYFWAKYLLNVGAQKKLVFMHNDLYAETNRKIDGKYPLKNDLLGLFSLYPKFDKILSVSYDLKNVNKQKLSGIVEESQMDFVENSININNILNDKKNDEVSLVQKKSALKILAPAQNIELFKNKTKIPDDSIRYENDQYHLVDSIACYELNGKQYEKILLNGEYLGWVAQNNLRDAQEPEEIFSFKSNDRLSFPVRLKIITGNIIIRNYPNITSSFEIIETNIYCDSPLFVTKIAVDRYYNYVLIETKFKKLGWVISDNVEVLESQGEFLNIINNLKDKIEQRNHIKNIKNELFARLTSRSILFKFYADIENKPITWDTQIPYVYKIIDRVVKNNDIYSLLEISNYKVGWVREDSLEFLKDRLHNFDRYESAKVNLKNIIYQSSKEKLKLYNNDLLTSYIEVPMLQNIDVESISIKLTHIIGLVYYNNQQYFVSSENGYFEKIILKNVLELKGASSNSYELENPIFLISEIISQNGTKYKTLVHNNILLKQPQSFLFAQLNKNHLVKKYSVESNYVTLKSRDAVWEQPYGVGDVKKVATTYLLRGLIFSVDAEIKLLNGSTYQHLMHETESIGWVNKKSVETHFSNDSFNNLFLPVEFKLLNQNIEFKVMNSKVTTFEYLRELSISKQNNNFVQISDKAKFDALLKLKNGNTYYRLAPKQLFKGWVSERDLLVNVSKPNLVNIDEKNKLLKKDFYISEKKIVAISAFLDKTTLLYRTYADIVQGKTIEKITESIYSISKIVNFKSGFYYEVLLNNEVFYAAANNLQILYSDFLRALPEQVKTKIEPTDLILSTMGRLSPEKNQGELIKAINQLIDKYPTIKLLILGKGPMKTELQKLIEQNDLENNVFLVGQYAHPFDIIAQSDVFVLPSVWEGQPMVLLEALTLNKKIVSSDLSQNAYVLGQGKFGLIAKGHDQNELAKTIDYSLSQSSSFEVFDAKEYNEKALLQFENQLVIQVNLEGNIK